MFLQAGKVVLWKTVQQLSDEEVMIVDKIDKALWPMPYGLCLMAYALWSIGDDRRQDRQGIPQCQSHAQNRLDKHHCARRRRTATPCRVRLGCRGDPR